MQSEESVFDAIIEWISIDDSERSKYITRLLKAVRLPLLEPAIIIDKVMKNPLVRSNLECRDMIDEALICVHLLPERKVDLPLSLTQPRMCMSEGGVLYVVGGLGCAENSAFSVEKYVTCSLTKVAVEKFEYTILKLVYSVYVYMYVYSFCLALA